MTLTEKIVISDPAAMCRAAPHGLGVTFTAVPDVLLHLESGALIHPIPTGMPMPARSRSITPAARCSRQKRTSSSTSSVNHSGEPARGALRGWFGLGS